VLDFLLKWHQEAVTFGG